jgi:hypothetical protein
LQALAAALSSRFLERSPRKPPTVSSCRRTCRLDLGWLDAPPYTLIGINGLISFAIRLVSFWLIAVTGVLGLFILARFVSWTSTICRRAVRATRSFLVANRRIRPNQSVYVAFGLAVSMMMLFLFMASGR